MSTRRHGRNHRALGVIGTIVLVAAALLALNSAGMRSIFFGTDYTAEFTEAGGLAAGDTVLVSGVRVGKVRGVELVDDHVRVRFELTSPVAKLGTSTRAVIVSQTALGKKALEIIPAGPGKLDDAIPRERTTPPFDVTQALSQLTSQVTDIDTDQLKKSLDEVAEVLRTAAPQVKPALEGIGRLSDTLGSRDAELSRLIDSSAGVTQLLADRDEEIQSMVSDGASLLTELNSQRDSIDQLFNSVDALAKQLDGAVKDNQKSLAPALKEVRGVLEMLQRNRANIDHALASASPLMRELGEVVAAFPGFNVYIPNLAMTNLVLGQEGGQ